MSEEIDLVWHMVDAVEDAFKAEAGALSGRELMERSELTNARLRTAWRIVLTGLPERVAA